MRAIFWLPWIAGYGNHHGSRWSPQEEAAGSRNTRRWLQWISPLRLDIWGGLKELLEMIQMFLEQLEITITFTTVESLLLVFEALASWLMTVVTGILAIVLSATVLAGKRFSGFVSFLLFFLIAWGSNALMNRIPDTLAATSYYLLSILAALACTAVMYLISGWIMERKLSV